MWLLQSVKEGLGNNLQAGGKSGEEKHVSWIQQHEVSTLVTLCEHSGRSSRHQRGVRGIQEAGKWRTPTQTRGQSLASEQEKTDSCSSREKRKWGQIEFFPLKVRKTWLRLISDEANQKRQRQKVKKNKDYQYYKPSREGKRDRIQTQAEVFFRLLL